ncbi:hypothetical protein BKA59DRAFT_454080 [Fusarium tricinctum]|uniref:Uncharacterized protein n=1 Tax=Fusarium tricinctum TaxID=61284 RepID=A0A8K0RVF0_9HYPO|nr:hypothetical protein BKA59DRAFT_454080 [Fusarium tricinctum]
MVVYVAIQGISLPLYFSLSKASPCCIPSLRRRQRGNRKPPSSFVIGGIFLALLLWGLCLSSTIATLAPLLEPAPSKHAEALWKHSLIHLCASADIFQIDGIIAAIVDKRGSFPTRRARLRVTGQAQTIWDVRRTRTAAQLDEFLAKIRVYAVIDQDHVNDGEGYVNRAQFWMRKTFKLFYIWAESAWLTDALASVYTTYKYAVEGDSSSWLHSWPGLNDPKSPSQAGFSGRFIYRMIDFIVRIDWAANGTGNRNPKLTVTGNNGYDTLVVEAASNEIIILSAVGSSDPDGNTVKYNWTQDFGAGYTNTVPVKGSASEVAVIQVSEAAAGKDIHIVLRGVDNDSPPLAAFHRAILHVTLKDVGQC